MSERRPVEVRSGTRDAQSNRLRAAWLYYTHGLTQQEVSERLGIARTTVVRLLDEALKRGEVQIRIVGQPGDLSELALRLETRLGLAGAVVVPGGEGPDDTARAVGAALGWFMTDVVRDGMSIGLGWGRTLRAALETFGAPRRADVRVVSLLGGVIEVSGSNPMEVAWRVAGRLGAECFLFPAPLLVDSAETRSRLFQRCGLDRLERQASSLDLAIVSVGDIGGSATSLSRGLLTATEVAELTALGCVCDIMCNFLDVEGRSVGHPLNERVMSISLDTVARARHVVIATGGEPRAEAIVAAHRRIGCHTLVTDEAAARRILSLTG